MHNISTDIDVGGQSSSDSEDSHDSKDNAKTPSDLQCHVIMEDIKKNPQFKDFLGQSSDPLDNTESSLWRSIQKESREYEELFSSNGDEDSIPSLDKVDDSNEDFSATKHDNPTTNVDEEVSKKTQEKIVAEVPLKILSDQLVKELKSSIHFKPSKPLLVSYSSSSPNYSSDSSSSSSSGSSSSNSSLTSEALKPN